MCFITYICLETDKLFKAQKLKKSQFHNLQFSNQDAKTYHDATK